MSSLLIKQRVFSWTDTYDVYDSLGEAKYFVKADFFTLGHRIRVYEKATNREVGVIEEKIFRIFPEFYVYVNGVLKGNIKKRFSLLFPKFDVSFKNWKVEGDLFEWDYDITRDGSIVASISKELLHLGDTYVINVNNDEDELNALMVAIAIDAAKCSSSNN